ncbi:unnamed protein product [Somion occarium]|uniref:Beta-glucuronidase C-terminal domain-containing protein n=1 Tax=Somion occarium TaxID=3059160 RepID=A0ABP1CWD8_9APHY
MKLLPLLTFAGGLSIARAVTVYGVTGVVPQTALSGPNSTPSPVVAVYVPPAFNETTLDVPAIPDPAPPTQFTLQLLQNAQDVNGLSIPQSGAFYGFSIEMSVATQVIGINSSFLNPPFLNLMSLIVERAGHVNIRVGGNTQETAVLVDSLSSGKIMEKDKEASSNPTLTPTLYITPEILYMLRNVSSLLNARWYLGIPMNDTNNPRLQIGEAAEAILGDFLLGFQLGNEPNLYAAHGHRPQGWAQFDYFGEFGVMIQAVANDDKIHIRNNIIGPSISDTFWTTESVWDTGFLQSYAAFPSPETADQIIDPQREFPHYLNHKERITDTLAQYLNSSNIAQAMGKPFLMFETNTASCGGFLGLSDSYGAALWAIDFGLQMAYSNFSGSLLHVGGVSDVYNPFNPPQTNASGFSQWSVNPIFYSVLAVAETLGRTNASKVIDLQANTGDIHTPAYAIYENDKIARLALFNYVSDSTGASDSTVAIAIGGGETGQPNGTPASVKVKYLLAPSVSDKQNVTWAGQTLGRWLQSDGRFQGEEQVQTVDCDQGSNTCTVKVPAPGFALVFMSDDAFQQAAPQSTATFETTSVTRTINTATVDQAVLATSNGQNGKDRQKQGSTSKGSTGAAQMVSAPHLAALCLFILAGVSSVCLS